MKFKVGQDRCVELTEKLELLQPDLQKKDLSGCFGAVSLELPFHFYPFLRLGRVRSCQWSKPTSPFNPVIGVCPFAAGVFSGDLAADQLTFRG